MNKCNDLKVKIQFHTEKMLLNIRELKTLASKTEAEGYKVLKNINDKAEVGNVLSHITAENLLTKAQDVRYWATRLDLLLDLLEYESNELPVNSENYDTIPCSVLCNRCKDMPDGCADCK